MNVLRGNNCVPPQNDATNWTTTLNNQYVNYANISLGVAHDPFFGSDNFYVLWKSPDNKIWTWVDPTTNVPAFIQMWRADLKRNIVIVITDFTPFQYLNDHDFIIWRCVKFN